MTRKLNPVVIDRLKRLRSKGLTYKQLAVDLGIHLSTVQSNLHPKWQEYKRRYMSQRRNNIKFRQKERQNTKKWMKQNPEKHDDGHIDHLTRIAVLFGKQWYELLGLLYLWEYNVKKNFNYSCVVCGQFGNHAHHLFLKSKYPALCLNLNNGVVLCNLHHKEIHSPWNTSKANFLV